jgi:hypothetical protein
MAGSNRELIIEVRAEIDQLRRSMRNVQGTLNNASRGATRAGQQAGDSFVGGFNNAMKALASVVALKALFDFGKDAVETTAELKAMKEQYKQVMGDMKSDTDKYLGQMGKKWNKHPNELKSTFTKYFALLKGKGVGEKEAYALSKQYMERTVDANAFANESMEATTDRFTSMIKGEYDSVDTAMVNLSQTMLNDKAQDVYKKKWQDLSIAQQETIKTQMAMEQHTSAGVLGQGVREADSYANNMAVVKETWKQFQEVIGSPILGVVNEMLKAGAEILSRWVQGLKDGDPLIVAFTAVLGVLTAILAGYAIGAGISALATGALAGALAVLFSPIVLIIAGVVALVAVIVTLWKKNDKFRNFILKTWDKIKKAFVDAWEGIKKAWDVVGDFFTGIGTSIKDAFGNAIDFVKGLFDDLWGAVKGVVDKIKGIWNTITGKKTVSSEVSISDEGGNVQRNAKGGIFTGWSKLGNNIFGEAGHEAVVPLTPHGISTFLDGVSGGTGGGNVNNFYFDKVDLTSTDSVRKLAYKLHDLQRKDARNKGYGYGY